MNLKVFVSQIFLLGTLCCALCVHAQSRISMADAILKGRTTLAPANLRQLQWIPGTDQFSHVANNKIVRVQGGDLKADTLNALNSINEGLATLGLKALDGLPTVTWMDADRLWFHTSTDVLTWSPREGVKRVNQHPKTAENLDYHDKTLRAAYTVDNELRVSIGGAEQTVARSEVDGIVYGKSVHRDEFGISKGTFWSLSGRYLAFYRMDERMVTQYPIYVLDSMPAQVRQVRYPFAGAKSHHVTVGVFDTQTGKTTYLKTGEPAEQYLTNIAWTPDERHVLIAVLNREQNHCQLRQYEASTGAFVKTILEEKNDKWVEPEKPAAFVPGRNDRFVWQSERDGFNHLYLYDMAGNLLRKLSSGNGAVTNFYGFSADGTRCFYQQADESGLNRYVWASELATGTTAKLGQDLGTHGALVNTNGTWMLDVFSNDITPRLIYVQPTANAERRQIAFNAKNPLEGYALAQTRMMTISTSDGIGLNARLLLPPNFDAKQKYPVIVYVYNGPHVQLVSNTWLGGAELWMHHMAQEGYIVFTLDGRGSAHRGHAFESSVHRKLGTPEVADQLAGVEYLKVQPFVDAARIGIFGWSYGGFMTTSLMTRPEAAGAFKCGVAGGPVLDWRMYEIMYTERYMDRPQENMEGYEKNSLFNYIDNLKGRLLMIHGSSDDVVLWQHSLRYIRECVRKGRPIDYFVYPEHLHNVLGKDRVHLFEKIEQFFKEQL